MAVAYASQANSGWVTSTSTLVAKPSGLAVDDLMIAFFATDGNAPNLPSGFTSIGFFPGDGSQLANFIGYKFADSADVAGSGFTFAIGASAQNYCIILRVTGASKLAASLKSSSTNAQDDSTPSGSGVTPDSRGNNLLLQVWHGGNAVSSIGSYAIATSNPSWTEILDTTDGAGLDIGIAWAIRPEVTATGDFSAAGGGASSDFSGWLLSIAPALAFTILDSVTPTEAIKMGTSILINEQVTPTEDVSVEKERVWSSPSKPSTDWTYREK